MGNVIIYEGFGRTKEEALISLAAMVRYNHEGTTLHESHDIVGTHYIWDGRKHPVNFSSNNNRIRAFIK